MSFHTVFELTCFVAACISNLRSYVSVPIVPVGFLHTWLRQILPIVAVTNPGTPHV